MLSYNTDTDIDDKATDSHSYNKDDDAGIGKGYLYQGSECSIFDNLCYWLPLHDVSIQTFVA